MKIRGTTVFLIVVVVILLILAVVVNIDQLKQLGLFGGSKPERSRVEAREPNTNSPPVEETVPPARKEENEENSAELANSGWRKSLSPRLYGRPNPFLPLRGTSPKPKPEPQPEPDEKEAPGPSMQITAIFGGQAIIKVDGASKTVSAGDKLAEMEVVSIGENEVLLRKEDEDYTLTLGEEPKHVPPGEAE